MSLFRPTALKLVLALAMLALSSWLWRQFVLSTITDTFPWGFPLSFYLAWGPCPPGETCIEWRPANLVLDAILWYQVSAVVARRVEREGVIRVRIGKAEVRRAPVIGGANEHHHTANVK